MEAAVPGFSTTVIEDVRVVLSAPTSIDVVLAVGGVTETVLVSAAEAQSLLNAVNAEINTNLTQEQVSELPLNGGYVTQLALTHAGVTGPGGARTASINRTRGTFNNFTLDGVNNQDGFIRTDSLFGVIPLRETFIDQINITTANSDVDAGLGTSQTQFVTRSGSNPFSSEVFFNHRNEALNANNYFNKAAGLEKERTRLHQFGVNVGGPLVRDRFFFFFHYEEERQPTTASVVRRVLTAPARGGDFSYVRQDNGQVATVNLHRLTGIGPDTAVRSLVDMTPSPNDGSVGDGRNTAGFRFNANDETDSDWLVFRGDYVINPRHSATGTFHQFRLDTPNSVFNDIDSVYPGLPGTGQASRRRLGSFTLSSTLGPSVVNEARFGFQTQAVSFFNNETFPGGYRLNFGAFDNPVRNPGMFEAGTLPLSPISGSWYATVDLGLRKNIALPLSAGARMQIRVDAFNVFNRANFNIGRYHNPNYLEFGLISSTFGARQIQVGTRITF